jgi:hypothetical protein
MKEYFKGVVVAMLVFIIVFTVIAIWIVRVGDEAPPDAITVYPEAHEAANVK